VNLVSVVIPTFNSRSYISQSLQSVLGQTYPHIEIIVVDDGSVDDTVAVAERRLAACGRSWKILRLGENAGPSAARNRGWSVANGTWVQFLDSDDLLMPDKLANEMAVAAQASEDVAVVYSPWNWGFLKDEQIEWLGPVRRPFIAGKHPIMCLAGGCRSLLGSSLVRLSALKQVSGFDERLRFWECEEINVRLARVGAFLPAPASSPQYLWRLREDELYIGGAGSRYSSKEVALGWIAEVVKAAEGRKLGELELSADDRKLLLDQCTLWGRVLYSQHRCHFGDYLTLARALQPHIAPTYPKFISALSRLTGYEKAEAVAKVMRQPMVWLRKSLDRLGLRRANTIMELT
jgi:glycosyltransferase involved in cell wall biosynthesis